MRLEYHTLDVFTERPLEGNPLAVFPDGRGLSSELMQRIARELNLSETVFLLPPTDDVALRRLRIFTPAREVPFAGHPTLGCAYFLVASGVAEAGGTDAITIVLEEEVGPVPVEVRVEGGRPVFATLTAAAAPEETPLHLAPQELARLIGLGYRDVYADVPGIAGQLGAAFASAGLPFLVIPVCDAEAATRARLDAAALDQLLPADAPSRMVYVIAPAAGDGVDLHVRMFAPDAGVPEDPATGSAAAALGGYLGARAGDGDHRWELEQGIEMGRPSRLTVEARVRFGRVERVRVGGRAVMVAHGAMEVPG